jgi:hypothetical protein
MGGRGVLSQALRKWKIVSIYACFTKGKRDAMDGGFWKPKNSSDGINGMPLSHETKMKFEQPNLSDHELFVECSGESIVRRQVFCSFFRFFFNLSMCGVRISE